MHPSVIYLNNAATSWPKPQCVLDAVVNTLKQPPFGIGRTVGGIETRDTISLARHSVEKLFNVPDNICFTTNATDSLNLLISGFMANHKNCHVITTELDHNSVLRPLYEHQLQNRCTYSTVPFDINTKSVSIEAIEKNITPKTKLAVITHASNVLGSVQDIKSITKRLHENDIFVIVDGAQSAGHIPLDLPSLGMDAFVFTGHKGLFGIPGTGGFWIQNPETIEPIKYGGTGTVSQELKHPRTMPERFETGTQNYTGLAALSAGINFIMTRTLAKIHQQGLTQSKRIIQSLKEHSEITIHNETPDIPIISLNVQGISPEDFGYILARKYHIISRTGFHCSPLTHNRLGNHLGSLRLSLSAMTTEDECTAVCDAFDELLNKEDHTKKRIL